MIVMKTKVSDKEILEAMKVIRRRRERRCALK